MIPGEKYWKPPPRTEARDGRQARRRSARRQRAVRALNNADAKNVAPMLNQLFAARQGLPQRPAGRAAINPRESSQLNISVDTGNNALI